MKGIISVLVALVVIQFTFSCSCCTCEDDPIEPFLSDSCSFKSVDVVFLDNSGEVPVIINKDSITRKAFGLQVNLGFEQAYCSNNSFNSPFFPTATALSCDCDDPVPPLIYPFKKFEIISLGDLRSSENDSVVTDRFMRLEFDTYSEIFAERFYGTSPIDLILTDAPDSSGNHQFILNFTFQDSTVFSDTTKMIHLF